MSPGVAAVAVYVCEGGGGLEGRSKEVGHINIFLSCCLLKFILNGQKNIFTVDL